MRIGEVELSGDTAEALDSLDIVGHVGRVNIDVPQMAWLAAVLRHVDDSERTFPRGKWATIQHIEAQVEAAARQRAEEIGRK